MSSKILVVEDNQDSRNLIHFYLTLKGFAVASAIDGTEGLYMAKAEMPDVIITDLMMPNLDGVEMIKQIRSDSETAHIHILIYTARTFDEITPAIEAGAEKAFYKPFDFDNLIEYVTQLLNNPPIN